MAKITITSSARSETRNKKDGSGTYLKRTQDAVIETSGFRVSVELDVEPENGYPLGVYEVDMEAQLKPGRFGLEMPRYWKLGTPKTTAKA